MISTPLAIENLLSTLKEIGLSIKEANIYLTLLHIKTNAASIIAKKAGLNRCSCYTILERLIQKGFIQKIVRNNVNYYMAVELRYVLNHLKSKHHDLENKIEYLAEAVTQLNLLKNTHDDQPKVIFYEGEISMRNMLEDRLNAKGLIRCYGSLNELESLFPNYLPEFYRRRVAKGIYVKAIYPANEHSFRQKTRDHQELRQTRLIPREFDLHIHINIYNNRVTIASLKEKFGVLIESRAIAEAQSKIFDFIWAGIKRYDEIMTRTLKQELERSSKLPDKSASDVTAGRTNKKAPC